MYEVLQETVACTFPDDRYLKMSTASASSTIFVDPGLRSFLLDSVMVFLEFSTFCSRLGFSTFLC